MKISKEHKTSRLPFRLRLLKPLLSLGPAALPVFIVLSGLSILTAFRIALTIFYLPRLHTSPEYLWLFPVGLRMDLILLSYGIIAPAILTFLLPAKIMNRLAALLAGYTTLFLGLILYMEIATFPFMEEFDLRPDQKFLEYLQHVYEVFTTVWKVYKFEIFLAVIVMTFAIRFFWRSSLHLIRNQTYYSSAKRLSCFLPVAAAITLGARSTLGHRPANLSTASFSNNHLVNEIALNSTYTVAYAAYRMSRFEKNPSLMYGDVSHEEVFKEVKNATVFPGEPMNSDIPHLQKQISPFVYDKPPNVVIFIQESMGAVDVGCLKGPDITPNLCRLKDEGLWFSQMYATGTRTVRGIEAIVSSFLPTAARGVVKLPKAKQDFFTAAALFKEEGYLTSFIYGGMSNFDEMRSFFLGNDFEEIYDEPHFENPAFLGTWGVSDEDLVRKANDVYKSYNGKPFFSVILSTSNHTPYEFPDGRIELYEQPKQTHFNAIKYADYAIGLFFDLAKKEDYYSNTIFLIVADHNSHVRGNDLVPISKFHIPALLIGPNVPKKDFPLQSSQIDLLPTILHFTGLETIHPIIGRNLMTLPPGTPGRSFMQYGDNNAYRVEDEVVILQPFKKPAIFAFENEKLRQHPESASESEVALSTRHQAMAQTALAYAHLPWILYSERLYRTKPLNHIND